MKLSINGETREVAGGTNLQALLAALKLDVQHSAVERNLAIVPKSLYGETVLEEGDVLEIVEFIGGG